MSGRDGDVPIFVFSPFVSSTMRIEPGWIDYNGHLNMAYYVVLFDRAADELFAVVGLGPDYLAGRGFSFFTAETHTRYLRELTLESRVRVTVQIVAHDNKRLHAWFEMRDAAEGWVAATSEQLFLHVEMGERKVAPFPDDISANVSAMQAAHARLPVPEAVGRRVSLSNKPGRTAEADPVTHH